MKITGKPTRRDLLIIVGELQNFIGQIAAAANDRNPNRAADIERLTREAHNLCVSTLSFDPPLDVEGVPKSPRIAREHIETLDEI